MKIKESFNLRRHALVEVFVDDEIDGERQVSQKVEKPNIECHHDALSVKSSLSPPDQMHQNCGRNCHQNVWESAKECTQRR